MRRSQPHLATPFPTTMDPPPTPHPNPCPLIALTPQISLARPLEPHTYEELIREKRRFEFSSFSNSEDECGCESQDCDGEHKGSRGKVVHATHFSGPHEKQNSFPHDTMSLPFPAYADPSTETFDLPALSMLAQKEDLLTANTNSAASRAFHTPASYSTVASPDAPARWGGGDSKADRKGKRRTRCGADERPYFGSDSKMNLESMQSSHGTIGCYESLTSNETSLLCGSEDGSDGGNTNQGLGVDTGCRNNICSPRSWCSNSSNITHPAPWGVPERANEELNSRGEDRWNEQAPTQNFEAPGGDTQQGWGNCCGNNKGSGWNRTNNNHPDAWGANADDGKVFEDKHQRRKGHVRSRHPSLTQNVGALPSFPDPSRRLSESTVRPLPQHQQQLPHITPPTEMHTHYHHHTYAHGAPDQSSRPQQNEREYIRELREQNANQAELLTEQRIRIAVLENNLKHMKKSKEDAVNASIFIAQKLGSIAKAKVKGKECMVESSKKMSNAKHGALTSDANKRACGGGLRATHNEDKGLIKLQKSAAGSFERPSRAVQKSSDSDNETKGVSGWSESFSSDITTVPNSPNLNPSFSSSGSDAIRQYEHSLQPVNRMSDVGLQSLDDCLNGNMDDHPPAPMASKETVEPLSTPIETRMKAMLSFGNVPPPSVLKTGFDLANTKRGAEYDHLARQPEIHRRKNYYSHFDPTSTSNPYTGTTAHKLWESSEEREGAIEVHQSQIRRDGIRYPDMFKYGIQYVPEEEDENYFRTVCISNLPADTELREVLARVRGGLVADAVLMDTRRLMGGTMSAMIVFVEDNDAKAFVDYAAAHPFAFGEDDDTIKAVVTLIATPTYPMSPGMIRRIKQEHKDTRCLAIKDFPHDLSLSKLQLDIACRNGHRSNNLIEFYLDEHNTLHLEFSSIPLAGSSFAILTHFLLYRGLEVNFEPDPCAGPLEELALPVPPRPPMLPRTRCSSPPYDLHSLSDEQASLLTTVSGEIIQTQRKRLAALSNQKVEIPSFSGAGIASSSWADEVIEESESTDIKAPVSANPSYSSNVDAEHDEQCEPPHTHSEVPPNSPVAGVLPRKIMSSVEVKEVVEALLMDNVNVLMKENPAAFRHAPIGLAGSKYATTMPRFQDINATLKGQNNMMSSAEDNAPECGDSQELFQADATEPKMATGSEKGKDKEANNTTTLQFHTEPTLGKLPSAELSPGYEDLPQRSSSQLTNAFSQTSISVGNIAEEDPFSDPTPLGRKKKVTPSLEYVLNKPRPRQAQPVQKDDFDNEKKAIPSSSSLTSPIARAPCHAGPPTELDRFYYKAKAETTDEVIFLHDPATIGQEPSATPEKQTFSVSSQTPQYIVPEFQVREHVETPQNCHIHDHQPTPHQDTGVGLNRVILGYYYPGMDFASFTPSKWTPGDIENPQSSGLEKEERGTGRVSEHGAEDSEVISEMKIGSLTSDLMESGVLSEAAWTEEQKMVKNPDEIDLGDEDEVQKAEVSESSEEA
jgi:hypothetical protein